MGVVLTLLVYRDDGRHAICSIGINQTIWNYIPCHYSPLKTTHRSFCPLAILDWERDDDARAYKRNGKNHFWYCTWVIEDGSLDLHLESTKKHLTGPCVFIIPPGMNHRIDLPMGTSYSLVEWGVTNARKQKRGYGAAYRYAERKNQPGPMATWGLDLPIVLPDRCYDLCSRMAVWVCSQWWRNEYAHAAANGCLGQWIGELLNEINDSSHDFHFMGNRDPEIQHLLKIAQNHLDKSFTIERACWHVSAATHPQIASANGRNSQHTLKSHAPRNRKNLFDVRNQHTANIAKMWIHHRR